MCVYFCGYKDGTLFSIKLSKSIDIELAVLQIHAYYVVNEIWVSLRHDNRILEGEQASLYQNMTVKYHSSTYNRISISLF